MWRESVEYHAMGIALLVIFAAIAVFGVLPGRARRAAMRVMIRREPAMHALYVSMIVVLIAYGSVRAVAVVVG